MTYLGILAAIGLVAWFISQTSITPATRNAVWIIASVLALIVVVAYFEPGLLRR